MRSVAASLLLLSLSLLCLFAVSLLMRGKEQTDASGGKASHKDQGSKRPKKIKEKSSAERMGTLSTGRLRPAIPRDGVHLDHVNGVICPE